MEADQIEKVKSLLHDEYTEDEIQAIVSQIDDHEVLYVYTYNYNWDNGFEIPQLVLDNDECDLSIALLVFYRADGISYLFNKFYNERLPQWSCFIKKLYDSILGGKYQSGEIEFKIPLSKVQLYKLKKILTKKENIFIENIVGKSLDIHM